MGCHTFFYRTIFFFLSTFSLFGQDSEIVYLTWKGDPSTTMTVMWLTETGNDPAEILYKPLNVTSWEKKEGTKHRLSRSSVTVHTVELTGLQPDTEYTFRLVNGELRKFKTLPSSLERPLQVAIGGDAYYKKDLNTKMNQEVASKSPDFVILVGDIAYTEGIRRMFRTRYWKINRWLEFFSMWSKDMVTKEGLMIPIISGIGNHDLLEGFDDPMKKEVLFYEFFVFPEKGVPFQNLKVGQDICFYILDSGHSFPVGGRQTEWLKGQLRKNRSALYHIPAYHIAAYPSVTSFKHRNAEDIRRHWVPLFEQYGVKVSMEHDNHAFKRTYPLRKGLIDQGKGIYYLGDGSWGVVPDKPKNHWYLAKAAQTNCYWLATFSREKSLFQAFDIDGSLIDELTITPISQEAQEEFLVLSQKE